MAPERSEASAILTRATILKALDWIERTRCNELTENRASFADIQAGLYTRDSSYRFVSSIHLVTLGTMPLY